MVHLKQYPIIYFKIKTMLKLNKYKEAPQNSDFFLCLCICKHVKLFIKISFRSFFLCLQYKLPLPIGSFCFVYVKINAQKKVWKGAYEIINSGYTCREQWVGELGALCFSILLYFFPLIIYNQNVVIYFMDNY